MPREEDDDERAAHLRRSGLSAQAAPDSPGRVSGAYGLPDSLIPWQRLEDRIGPHYFRSERGRRPYPLAVMLRVHIVQLCYNLSDPAMEDLLYEAESVRRFAGPRLSEPIPDESTILHFRHLLERHELGQGTV